MVEETTATETHAVLNWLAEHPGPDGLASVPSNQLVRWLQGDDDSTAGEQMDPHAWILEAVDQTARPRRVREQLARHCRSLLELRPDRMLADGSAKVFRRPAQFLRNLFWLCAELVQPEILWAPLLAVYNERCMPARLDKYDLVDALRAALIQNQLDAELKTEWFSMLSGDRTYLNGNRTSGFRGVVAMPESPAQLGKPWVVQIASALKVMADYLAGLPDRRKEFHLLVAEAKEPFPQWESADSDLSLRSIQDGWPMWANWLYVPVSTNSNGMQRAYVWKYIADCMPDDYCQCDPRAIFGGEYYEVALSPEGQKNVTSEIVPMFEEYVMNNPFSSVGAMLGVVSHVMDLLERRARLASQESEANAAKAARARVLAGVFRATLRVHPEREENLRRDLEALIAQRYDTQDLTTLSPQLIEAGTDPTSYVQDRWNDFGSESGIQLR